MKRTKSPMADLLVLAETRSVASERRDGYDTPSPLTRFEEGSAAYALAYANAKSFAVKYGESADFT